jgi:hypothetical protein
LGSQIIAKNHGDAGTDPKRQDTFEKGANREKRIAVELH